MRKIFTNIMWIPSFSFSLVILSVTFLLYFVNVSGANNKNWMLKKSSSPDDNLRDSSISLNLDLYNYSHSSNINGNVDRSRPRSHHLRRSNNNNGGSGSGGGGGRKHKNNNKNNGHKSQDIPHRHQRRGGGGRGQRQRMNKNALRLLSGISDNIEGGGAFPPLFNIAPRAIITVNATCGLNGREEYCKLVDAQPHNSWATQCGICDGQSLEMEKQHPIESVLDSLDNWWQSPTLQYGKDFEYITIQFDLKQAFQIFSIMIKSAISPRPASWILEKSLDNITYIPWQYFGTSDLDCRRRYNLPGQTGKYSFESDDEVICTTQFSKAMPLENGEIHVSLMKNRPGAMEQSQQLMDFITARFIRIRFQGMHSTANSDNSVSWILDSAAMEKRSFYSIKLIRISGRLACNGHASRTLEMVNESGESELICDCQHNTCGSDCHECCSLFNQVPFNPGTYKTENICEECQCNGHSYSCIYDEYISKKLSTNIYGIRQGGGVCLNCTNFTEGFNCEKCQKGYFRPSGVYPYDEMPCQRCDCDPFRSTGDCDSESGKCFCKEGFHGHNCMECSDGYKGDACTKCTCDKRGTLPGGQCEDQCQCKFHVEGHDCSECTPGYFSLRQENPEGCLKCFCSGVGLSCKSSKIRISSYETLESWAVTDITKSVIAYPVRDNETGYMVFGMYELSEVEAVYWLAPAIYEGNHLTSYGSKFVFEITWIVVRGDTSGKPNPGPNLILIGKNGMKIAYGDEIFEGSRAVIDVLLTEDGWYHIPKSVKDIITRSRRTEYKGDPVTRNQFMSVLNDIESVLIRGTFHTDQAESILEKATLYSGGRDVSETEMSLVEECVCPPGYTGLSCESCAFGYIRTYENSTTHELIGKCLPCACNGHAETCELETGVCGECQHNTFGERCERCKVGFYGNAMHGTSQDCNRCACPLLEDDNNFSPSCQLKKLSLDLNLDSIHLLDYVCTQCPNGFIGDHCEICDDGFWGDPLILGSKCLPCLCHGGPCDPETGQCITCLGNTEGWKCERCKSGFWGDPELGCEACECYDDGSITSICDSETGQCSCKNHFTGLKCDECVIGYADPDLECAPCDCNRNGSLTDSFCDPFSGKCVCKTGVVGLKCDECQEDYFGLKDDGCEGEYIKFD